MNPSLKNDGRSVLKGKKVLLGITGGIAAYKSAFLVRLLVKAGCEVKVIMTPEAQDFVTPLTLSTLSKNPIFSEFSDEKGNWHNHVELAQWADWMCVAPATAHSIAKMATGQSDNLLLATYLSASCPVYVAPAMDLDMYQHPATRDNLARLEGFGNRIIPAESGELASGLYGAGRMAEPENILAVFERQEWKDRPLKGKRVLVTAGPTYEPLDPVRFIGNHSSGKMGFALAEEASDQGAEVILVTGPTSLTASSGINTIRVTTTREMYQAVHDYFDAVDLVIAAAAVADYRPQKIAKQKIKKKETSFTLTLEKTEDILLSLGQQKKHQVLVGFALETEEELKNAQGKLEQKNLDLIVLNSLNDEGSGFKTETNKVTLIGKTERTPLPLLSKRKVAKEIVAEAIRLLEENKRRKG